MTSGRVFQSYRAPRYPEEINLNPAVGISHKEQKGGDWQTHLRQRPGSTCASRVVFGASPKKLFQFKFQILGRGVRRSNAPDSGPPR